MHFSLRRVVLALALLAPASAFSPSAPRSSALRQRTLNSATIDAPTAAASSADSALTSGLLDGPFEELPATQRFKKGAKQVTTLGPRTFSFEMIEKLFLAGSDVFRLNLSHGREEKAEVAKTIREVEAKYGHPIGILADLQGPKQRMGMFTGDADSVPRTDKYDLEEGSQFRLDSDPATGDSRRVFLPHPEILAALEVGKTVLLDDGNIRLRVTEKGDGFVDTIVTNGNSISSRKGVNTPDVIVPVSPITEKDRLDLEFILKSNVDWVALSFVQVAGDMEELRELVDQWSPEGVVKPKILAKIEKPCAAMEELESIVAASDGIMVARGDLGVEMNAEDVPLMQKRIIDECRLRGKPVIVATQMLESMMENPSPTRAETSDVANAIFDGADAVMLSGESANGKYPEPSVAMQCKIINRVEADPMYRKWKQVQQVPQDGTDADALTTAATALASATGAKCIAIMTTQGTTVNRMARFRPGVPILALTPNPEVARALALVNGVWSDILDPSVVECPPAELLYRMIEEGCSRAKAKGLVTADTDKIVFTCGLPFGQSGISNTIRVVEAGCPPDSCTAQ